MKHTYKDIEDEINHEEVFKQIHEFKADPNAVYVEYNPSVALEKLLNIHSASPAEQLSYAKHFSELMEVMDDEGLKSLGPILDEFTNEADNIKMAILTQIAPLTNFLHNRKYYKEIVDSVLPNLSKLLTSPNMAIKEEAGENIGKVAHFLNEEDRGKYILTTVLSMAHDDLNENNRIVAVQLLSKMASCFGKDLCEQFVGLEFLSLGEDPQIRVRKEAINNLSLLAKVVTHGFFKQRLLPFYLSVTNDNAWVVRKACVDNLVEITQLCEPNDRESFLTVVMLKFLKDTNKWVKISSFKQLGPFISTLAGLNINEKLYESYCMMTDPSLNSISPDNEIIISCAFNFPAVLQSFGAYRWPHMSKMFNIIMKKGPEIRKPLACSLHEIARIIGPDKAEKDLIPILESVLKDQNDEVKYGAIKNLSSFLTVFDTDKKENLIDVFLQLQKDPKKWRIRVLIARQIDKLAHIYHAETVFRIISPISFKLCNDPVSIVREKASKKIPAVLIKLIKENEELYKTCVIENIKGFSLSSRFNQRQAFLFMSEKLLNYPEIFIEHILPSFKNLVNDKVCNVRLILAKVVSRHWKNKGKMRTNPEFIAITKALQSDKSKDVTHFLEGIRFDEEELKSPEDLSNGKIKSTSPLKSLSKSQINGNLNNLNEEIRIEVLKLNEEKRIEELKLNEEKKTEELKLNAEKRIEEFKLKTESEIIEEIRKLELVLNSSEKILKKLEITQSIKEKLLDEKENSIIIKDSGITEENLTDNKQEDVFEVNKKESLDKEYNGKEDEKVIKEEKL